MITGDSCAFVGPGGFAKAFLSLGPVPQPIAAAAYSPAFPATHPPCARQCCAEEGRQGRPPRSNPLVDLGRYAGA